MKTYEMIPPEQQSKYSCFHCGTKKSVKYAVKANGSTIPVCNFCYALYHSFSLPEDGIINELRSGKVIEYCCNDVNATEAVFNHLKEGG